MKPTILIIDGMDRTGKTSLIREINKLTDYLPLIIDRGPIGYKTYCELYSREVKPEAYDNLERELCNVKHLCVYLHASQAVIEQRFLDTGEPVLKWSVKKNLDVYNKYYELSKLNKIKFDSGKLTTAQLARFVIEAL